MALIIWTIATIVAVGGVITYWRTRAAWPCIWVGAAGIVAAGAAWADGEFFGSLMPAIAAVIWTLLGWSKYQEKAHD
jgi:hypothetical protein